MLLLWLGCVVSGTPKTFESTYDPTWRLADMTPPQVCALEAEALAHYQAVVGPPDLCRATWISFATLLGTEACEEAIGECDTSVAQEYECAFPELPDTCEATVGDYVACIDASARSFIDVADGTCGDVFEDDESDACSDALYACDIDLLPFLDISAG